MKKEIPSLAVIEQMIAECGSLRAAARKFGVHHRTVSRWLIAYGLGPAIKLTENESVKKVEHPREIMERAYRLQAEANECYSLAVETALRLVGGNVGQAADMLDLDYRNLGRMIRSGRLVHLRHWARRKRGRPGKAA